MAALWKTGKLSKVYPTSCPKCAARLYTMTPVEWTTGLEKRSVDHQWIQLNEATKLASFFYKSKNLATKSSSLGRNASRQGRNLGVVFVLTRTTRGRTHYTYFNQPYIGCLLVFILILKMFGLSLKNIMVLHQPTCLTWLQCVNQEGPSGQSLLSFQSTEQNILICCVDLQHYWKLHQLWWTWWQSCTGTSHEFQLLMGQQDAGVHIIHTILRTQHLIFIRLNNTETKQDKSFKTWCLIDIYQF